MSSLWLMMWLVLGACAVIHIHADTMPDGEPVPCLEATYRGERWRKVNETGEASQCRCGYYWHGTHTEFKTICKLEGCEGGIHPGGVTWQDGGWCRCVPGTDPDLEDGYTLYHIDCSGIIPKPGCQYNPTMIKGRDITAAPGEMIEIYGSLETCTVGPGAMADDPYGFFYWKGGKVIDCEDDDDHLKTWKTIDEKGRVSVCTCDFARILGEQGPYGRVCKLEGCETSTDPGYIRPGETIKQDGEVCSCVKGTDPDLADVNTLYYLKCESERVDCALSHNENRLHPYPGDKAKFIQCGYSGSSWVMPCAPGTWFSFETQDCSIHAYGK